MLLLYTRHSESFDIFTKYSDPASSYYAGRTQRDYVEEVSKLYKMLDVPSAIWTHQIQIPVGVDGKLLEYSLEIHQSRVIAYLNEVTWSAYLAGKVSTFEHSLTPETYEHTTVLVRQPLQPHEVKKRTLYELMPNQMHVQKVKSWTFDGVSAWTEDD